LPQPNSKWLAGNLLRSEAFYGIYARGGLSYEISFRRAREGFTVKSAAHLLFSEANLRVRRQPPGWLPSRAQLSTTCVTPRSAPRARSLSDILQSSSTFRHQTFQAPFPRPDTNTMHQFPDNSNTYWRPVLWRIVTRPASSARRLMNIWALLTWCGLGAR